MTDEFQSTLEHVLIRDMGITQDNIERRKQSVGYGPEDVSRVLAIKEIVTAHIDEYATTFFNHLAGQQESRALFANRDFIDKTRRMKVEHLGAMVSGDYGPSYVEQRVKLASLYNRAGLEPRVFLGAFHALLRHIGANVIKHYEREPIDGYEHFMSLQKIAFFDVGIIVDAMIFERERVIRQQQEAIRELSTPVLQVRERLLLLPIIGVIDTHRARLITENLLRAIRANRAKVVVMDVTGVATVDSKVANHLLQTVTAARLMGAVVIVTGLSSEVAQSLVALGIELTRFNTVGDLQGGLEEAERLLGYRMTHTSEPTVAGNGGADAPEGNGNSILPLHA